jgi:hypothetical protein
MALQVKDAYGINEKLLNQLAQSGDPTWDKFAQIWQKAKFLRFDSLTKEQMHTLEALEMDLQEAESGMIFSLY